MSSASHSFRGSVDILEELQLIAAQNLERLDMDKYYEVVCELGKGTYGKVDLVVHKIRGEPQLAPSILGPSIALLPDCVLCRQLAGRNAGASPEILRSISKTLFLSFWSSLLVWSTPTPSKWIHSKPKVIQLPYGLT